MSDTDIASSHAWYVISDQDFLDDSAALEIRESLVFIAILSVFVVAGWGQRTGGGECGHPHKYVHKVGVKLNKSANAKHIPNNIPI